MNSSLSAAAAKLLDFIASFESSESSTGYEIIYGNHQDRLSKPIILMSLNELLSNQVTWGRMYGSSAAGRNQFMPKTLMSLMKELNLTGREVFNADMQDKLGFALLRRRGFDAFMARMISIERFGLGLAQEWASLPVLSDTQGAKIFVRRGQSYYAGVFTNKAGVTPDKVEAVLHAALALPSVSTVVGKTPEVVMVSTGSAATSGSPDAGAFDPKPWYLSKGVIGGLIAVAVPILSIFFPAARLVDPQTATDWVMKIIEIAGPVIGGLVAVVGRVQATQPISGTKAMQTFANAGVTPSGGMVAMPGAGTSIMDLPLSSVASDLPQVLLMLQNAGQLMASATGSGALGALGALASGHASAPPKPAGTPAEAPNGSLATDPHDLTVSHLQAISDLATKLSELAPTLARMVPGQPRTEARAT